LKNSKKDKGIDLLKGFKNFEEIHRYIQRNLITYELAERQGKPPHFKRYYFKSKPLSKIITREEIKRVLSGEDID